MRAARIRPTGVGRVASRAQSRGADFAEPRRIARRRFRRAAPNREALIKKKILLKILFNGRRIARRPLKEKKGSANPGADPPQRTKTTARRRRPGRRRKGGGVCAARPSPGLPVGSGRRPCRAVRVGWLGPDRARRETAAEKDARRDPVVVRKAHGRSRRGDQAHGPVVLMVLLCSWSCGIFWFVCGTQKQ